MLPQQVGFVCAVLALACCASGLFGSLGRCRCGHWGCRGVGARERRGCSKVSPLP